MNAIPELLAPLSVPVDGLKPYGRNPRVGDVAAIVASLEAHGQYRPIVVNRRTSEVLAGNHTLVAARQLGWTQIAATYVDVDDDQAARIVLVDNRSNDLAAYDDAALVELLNSLGDLEGTGFDDRALAELEAALADEVEARTDPDDVPAEPRVAFTRLGQTWLLGPHRLTVGDATDPGVLAEALDGRSADLVLTDPPYNVAYTGKSKDALTIDNDDMTDDAFGEFMADAYAAMFEVTIEGGPIYVFHADSESTVFRQAMVGAGWALKQCLIWVKDRFVLSRQDYHWQHEPILYGWKPGAAHRWNGGFTPATVIDDQPDPDKMTKAELLQVVRSVFEQTTAVRSDRPAANSAHPTAKPVALLSRLLENSSMPGDTVLDPFGGSGSTLIACHGTRRKAALVEVDPVYADVICRRYQEHTGTLPVLEGTGESHDFAA